MSASLGVHALLLALLTSVAPKLLRVPRLSERERPAVDLQLTASTTPRESASTAFAAAPAGLRPRIVRVEPRRAAAPAASPVTAPARTPTPLAPAPSAAAAGGDAAAPAATSQPTGRWRVTGGGGDADAAARALARGTVGCDHVGWLHLTAAERERCDSRFVEGARFGPRVDAVPAAKRAYFDQVRDAYAKMHEGAPLPFSGAPGERYSNLGVDEPWAGPKGAHMPGFGCSPALLGRKGPPHSLNFGPCVITPPSGFGTEEADVVPPPSAGAQRRDAAAAAKSDPPPPDQ